MPACPSCRPRTTSSSSAANALDARGGWRRPRQAHAAYRILNTATHPVRRTVHVRRISAFVAVSRFVAAVHRTARDQSAVLPNFVPRPPPVQPAAGTARHGIAFVGRLTEDKGIRDVLVLAEQLTDVPVTIVGTGTLESEVRARAAELPNVVLTGFVPHAEAARIVRESRARRLAVALPRSRRPRRRRGDGGRHACSRLREAEGLRVRRRRRSGRRRAARPAGARHGVSPPARR